MSSPPGDFYALAEKVVKLEEAVNSLGNEMQGKINFILEYFSSILEEQALIQKRCEQNSTRFKQLRLKCETRKGKGEIPEGSITEPISTSLGLNSKRIQDSENISLVPLRPPPPLQVSSQLLENIRSLQTQPPRSQQVRDRHNNLVSSFSKIDASREELSPRPELNQFLADIRSVDLPLRTESQILPECQTYTTSCSDSDHIGRDGMEMEEAVTTSLQQGNEEFDRVGTSDSLRDLTHLSEFVPVLNQREDLQFESVFISGSVKTEPDYFESPDDQMDNSMDNDQCNDQLSDAQMNSTFLPGTLGPDADMESYRILGNDQIEGSGIEEGVGSTAVSGPGSTRRNRPKKYKKLRLRNTIYQCPVCPKCYKTANNLRIHLRGHTGERPYMCTECDRSFADPSNLRKHMKKNYHLCLRKARPTRPRFAGIEMPTISPAGQIHANATDDGN